jgi:feruloyl esterase
MAIGVGLAVAGVARAQQPGAGECEKLKGLQLPNTRITAVEAITPHPVWSYPPSLFTTFMGKLGAPTATDKPFCRVVGVIEKEINFEVWLPAQWNGKFEGVGNGGFAGAINYPAMGEALQHGYATASTDTGHKTSGFFEYEWIEGHPDRVANFGYRAHHLMAQAGKRIVAAFYRKPAQRAYYAGCSSGGWQGLTEAQRYPQDYDGIVAGAPAINFVRLQSRGIITAQLLEKNPQGALTRELQRMLIDAAVAKCDAKDGVKDGVIDDPRQCDFDPAELQCKTGDTQKCLTPAQVSMARTLYGPMKSRGGLKLYPGPAYGAAPMADLPPSDAPTSKTGQVAMPLMLKHKPSWDATSFDPDRDIPPLEQELGPMLDSTNPDLRGFQAHGGKLILYHGWADSLLSPYNTLDYYDSVVAKLGQKDTDGFVRLFMVPGMEHCGGGPGPSVFDAVESLDQWVEHGVAPEHINAAHLSAGKVDRTRPLCRYPQVARYKGSGSTDEAGNFACQSL